MEDLVNRLEQDHRRIAQVLLHLVADLDSCHNAAFHNQRFVAHFINELNYIRDFPNRLNHPLENHLFSRLLEKDLPNRHFVERSIDEHYKLEIEAQHLVRQLMRILERKEAPSRDLILQAQRFMNAQIEHQEQESRYVFPLAKEYLGSEDAKAISSFANALPRRVAMTQHFTSIYNDVMRPRLAG